MRPRVLFAAFAAVALSTVANGAIRVTTIVAAGFTSPVQVTHAGDGSNRLFVVEQRGLIRIIKAGVVLPTPFLDLSASVTSGGERGLLGLAFHPSYSANGFFYVNYTNLNGNTVIARYTVSGNPDVANPASAFLILGIAQPFANHNGGNLVFHPSDGYLYIGMGDGGSGNDPFGHGQNKNTLLGKMLRIDVDGGSPYAIPADNPYIGGIDGADEVWAIGLRNPWRYSFDRDTGDLLLGDVGQNRWEEIDYQAAGTPGGLNFGWAVREGPCPRGNVMPCAPAPAGMTEPIAFYGRSLGASVTGGFVYRGSNFPSLVGCYLYADFISGRIWSLYKTAQNTWSPPMFELQAGFNVSSFGEDEAGELYIVDYSGGTIRRVEDVTPRPGTTRLVVDRPMAGAALLQPFTVAGWAVDPSASSGTGVDQVHVWAFPQAGGSSFLGVANYGLSRPDVGAFFGDSRFDNSGFSFNVSGLASGRYNINVYARSTARGTFNAVTSVNVIVGSDPRMNVEVPATGTSRRLPFNVSGWAIDRAAPSGSGISEVHVWAFRTDNQAGTFLGVATLGMARPDIAAAFGAQFGNAGFQFQVTTPLPQTNYNIVAYAKSAITGTFNNQDRVTVMVLPPVTNPAMAVDLPSSGASVNVPFNVAGWAADLGSLTGTGVDDVHVWAFPASGAAPVFLGVATYGSSRPDVGAVYGARFTSSGYSRNVTTPLPAGMYDIAVYAHSTVAGAFNNVRRVRVTVN